jgi:DnaK suppressor protein
MDDAFIARMREALGGRLELLKAAGEATADSRAPVELDQASVGRLSRMDALQVQAMAQASEARRRDEVRRIEAALRRIEQDEYGYCLRCGDDIAEGRLEADPTATVCIPCASSRS